MALPFVEAFIELPKGSVRDAPMIVVHTKYSELVLTLIKDWNVEEISGEKMQKV